MEEARQHPAVGALLEPRRPRWLRSGAALILGFGLSWLYLWLPAVTATAKVGSLDLSLATLQARTFYALLGLGAAIVALGLCQKRAARPLFTTSAMTARFFWTAVASAVVIPAAMGVWVMLSGDAGVANPSPPPGQLWAVLAGAVLGVLFGALPAALLGAPMCAIYLVLSLGLAFKRRPGGPPCAQESTRS